MWRLERKRTLYKRWHWELIFSAYGASWGRAWTKKGAEKQMLMEQGKMFGGEW